ncbi:MAG: sugar phosphate isomerase/epimerase family protein [Actinomycetota bacterium]
MHPRLSVSAVSSWRWTLDEDLSFWAEAEIDHVGLSFRKVEEAGVDAAVERVRSAGVHVSNLVELGWWELDDRPTWARQQERLATAVRAAAALDAPCVVLTTGPSGGLDWDDAAAALGEALGPVQAEASARDIVLAVEHTGSLRLDLSFVTTLGDGVDLARRLGTGVCMEVNSCFAERGLRTTIADAAEVLAHVQVSDFVVGTLSTPDRAVPGDGDIALDRVLGDVLGSGYEGALELELVGPRIEAEGYASAIARSVAYLDVLLRDLGA